jgi:hypothetical protein
MYIRAHEGLGENQTTQHVSKQPCDKLELRKLMVPFRPKVDDFLKLVCCAIGRWMIFRTDHPPGRLAWCFVKRNEPLLRIIHVEMSRLRIPCVELEAQYCRRGTATIEVRITTWKWLGAACPPPSLCKTGVCNPSVVCPPAVMCRPCQPLRPGPPVKPPVEWKMPELHPSRCRQVEMLSEAICQNSENICRIAAQLNEEQAWATCMRARASCEEARRKRCSQNLPVS